MNILDPKFRYVPAAKTDISKTFARVRKKINAAQRIRPHGEEAVAGFGTGKHATHAVPERDSVVAAPIWLRRKA